LGALLEATKETIALDTQAAAKDYFTENHKEVAPESPDMIKGTYDTAKAELKPETTATIKSTIEANKNMTNASITVSAGADLRLMTLATAQTLQQEKIATLIALEDDFTDAKNKAEIDSIVAEIEDTTSVESILDNGTGATDNSEQNGNRYLIAARIAE